MSLSHDVDRQDDHQARLASVGQIAAGIAHEVRNPLTAVKGFLQLLQRQSPHAYIDIAQQELENAIETLQNLLNVAKPDTEDEPITSFSLCTELESILSLFQDQIYQVTVERIFEHESTELVGRKNQLKRAFFNIIKNAFEAIPSEGKIKIHHYREDQVVHVIISDTGVGIPKEKLRMLGTPFFTTKSEGTGMGLVYVFSTVYQHGGTIDVESEEGQGTTFHFQFPLDLSHDKEVAIMNLHYEQGMDIQTFILRNQQEFERQLLVEAASIKEVVQDIKTTGNIDLLSNVHKLVMLTTEHKDMDIISFAQQEGQLWAKHSSFNLSVKLEWFQAVRRVLWGFLYNFERLGGHQMDQEQFFALERHINMSLDTFLRFFFMSYTAYKDEQIKTHKEMIDDLSVPLIPLSPSVSIFPLLGAVDAHRAKVIQEKVLRQIGANGIRTLVIDMSGVAFLDTSVVQQLFKVFEGMGYMGCQAIVTGIRPDIANMMVDSNLAFADRIQLRGTLQQALEELGFQGV